MVNFTEANRKGFSGEFLVISDLTEQGLIVLSPVMPSTSYDVVVDEGSGNFRKIQVKSCYEVDGKLSISNRKGAGSSKRHYEKGDYDILAVVNLTSRKVAYIAFDECNRCEMTFYTDVPDKVIKTTRLFDEYLEFPRLSELGNRSAS